MVIYFQVEHLLSSMIKFMVTLCTILTIFHNQTSSTYWNILKIQWPSLQSLQYSAAFTIIFLRNKYLYVRGDISGINIMIGSDVKLKNVLMRKSLIYGLPFLKLKNHLYDWVIYKVIILNPHDRWEVTIIICIIVEKVWYDFMVQLIQSRSPVCNPMRTKIISFFLSFHDRSSIANEDQEYSTHGYVFNAHNSTIIVDNVKTNQDSVRKTKSATRLIGISPQTIPLNIQRQRIELVK